MLRVVVRLAGGPGAQHNAAPDDGLVGPDWGGQPALPGMSGGRKALSWLALIRGPEGPRSLRNPVRSIRPRSSAAGTASLPGPQMRGTCGCLCLCISVGHSGRESAVAFRPHHPKPHLQSDAIPRTRTPGARKRSLAMGWRSRVRKICNCPSHTAPPTPDMTAARGDDPGVRPSAGNPQPSPRRRAHRTKGEPRETYYMTLHSARPPRRTTARRRRGFPLSPRSDP